MVPDRLLVGLSLPEAARGFLISMRAATKSPRYVDSLGFSLRLLGDFALERSWPPIQELDVFHLEEYLLFLQDRAAISKPGKLSQSSIESHYRRLSRFWRWLVDRGIVVSSPFSAIDKPKLEERVIPTVPDEDLARLLALVNPAKARTPHERFLARRNRAVIYLFIDTPGRLAEVSTLDVADVNLEEGMLKVLGKGRKERWMPIGAMCREALWDYLRAREARRPRTDRLWVSTDGRPIEPNALYLMLKRLGLRSGVPGLHPHRFRHTFSVSWLRQQGGEQMLRIIGGWRRIPETYLRTLAAEDAARIHQQLSPGDRLGPARSSRSTRRKM